MASVATHGCENFGPLIFRGFSAEGGGPGETSCNPLDARLLIAPTQFTDYLLLHEGKGLYKRYFAKLRTIPSSRDYLSPDF